MPDHHAVVELNGVEIADESFDGLVLKTISVALPDGLLREGANSLKVTLPGDTGADWDVVDFDGFVVSYPREMVAQGGLLEFETGGGSVVVDGFPTSNIVAYGTTNGELARLSGVAVEPSGLGFQASFSAPKWGCWNSYYVSPAYNTMAHRLLLSGDSGAAATWGAAVLTQVSSEQALGELMMPRLLQPGMTIGKAIQAAKAELAAENPEMLDVLVGWSLLGDPALEINQ